MPDIILTADTVITMDAHGTLAEAVGVSDGTIVVVGTLAEAQATLPEAEVVHTGASSLMPGFIEPHGHPVLTGMSIMPPARYIAPWVAPNWDACKKIFAEALAQVKGTDTPLVFFGFDALLHEVPKPTSAVLDEIFGDHEAYVVDNSGHGVYFTSNVIRAHGWDTNVPEDPTGGFFTRNDDGSLKGQGFEVPIVTMLLTPALSRLGGSALVSAALYYRMLSEAGITGVSDMTFSRELAPLYAALATMPSAPMRVSLWEVSTSPDTFDQPFDSGVGDDLVVKRGVKLWTDGSPWVGNVATSFPYLKNEITDRAGIDGSMQGEVALNYNRAELNEVLDRTAAGGWSASFHANGDMAIDQALDAMELALNTHGLIGTDHAWRLEHVGAGRADQFKRAAELGVHVSMGPFQFYYWGDLIDGSLFDHAHGERWQAFNSAVKAGATVSFHNDGAVSPPTPILNAQVAVTRQTRGGTVHGVEEAIGVYDALKAITINAARTMGRADRVGSIEVGKLADFVELNANPLEVDPHHWSELATVRGTWVGGQRVDLDEFMAAVKGVDAQQHQSHTAAAHQAHGKRPKCC